MDANLGAVIRDAGRGRPRSSKLRRGRHRFWPGSGRSSRSRRSSTGSRSMSQRRPRSTAEWTNTIVDRRRARRVRAGPDGPAGTATSASTPASRSPRRCSPGGVVDDLRLVIAPRIVGAGRRLLDGVPSTAFESVRAERTPSGRVLADSASRADSRVAPPRFAPPTRARGRSERTFAGKARRAARRECITDACGDPGVTSRITDADRVLISSSFVVPALGTARRAVGGKPIVTTRFAPPLRAGRSRQRTLAGQSW